MKNVLFASLLLQWILFDLVAAPGVFFRCGGALPDANNAALPYSIQAVGDLLRLITAQNFRGGFRMARMFRGAFHSGKHTAHSSKRQAVFRENRQFCHGARRHQVELLPVTGQLCRILCPAVDTCHLLGHAQGGGSFFQEGHTLLEAVQKGDAEIRQETVWAAEEKYG